MRDVLISSFTSVTLAAFFLLKYLFILPTNFLIIVGTLFILSLIVLAWDIYEWRCCENTIE